MRASDFCRGRKSRIATREQGWRQEFSDTGAEFPDAGAGDPL